MDQILSIFPYDSTSKKRPQRAKGSIFSLPNSLAAYFLLDGHSVGPQAPSIALSPVPHITPIRISGNAGWKDREIE
jgi:hypothetical protein